MQLRAGAGRIVVRVGSERGRRRVLRVTADADRVACGRRQPIQIGAAILGVRVVAGRARHLARAAAQQEVARLARRDRAAARLPAAPPLPLPGVRIAREQHLVAARADAVHLLGARHVAARLRPRVQERAARREVRVHARIDDVLAAAAVARLAADADLDEVARAEAGPQLADAVGRARRADRRRRAAACRRPPRPRRRRRPQQRVAAGADVVAPAPLARQESIDHRPLIGRRARPCQLAPQRVEVRNRVVAEDAGLAPDAAGAQPGPLAHQHRVALEAEAARLEHVRDREQELARVAAADLDAREVLAIPPADDAGDPVAVIAVLRRRQIDVALAVALDEPRRIFLEAERRRRCPPSAANGAWIPAPAGRRVIRCIGELRHAEKMSAWQRAQLSEPE